MEERGMTEQRIPAEFYSLPYFDSFKIPRYLNFKRKQEQLSWEEIITYVNLNLDYPFYEMIREISNPDNLTVLVNKYNRLPMNYIPQDLESIHPDFNSGEFKLRQEARVAFEKMGRAAGQDGIMIQAISTFRSFDYQEEVYFRKKSPEISMEEYRKERDRVSARPGHSEHQTGLAVDINDLEQSFEQTPAGKWLAANSYHFGYILRYPKGKEYITGYDYEPWHFRYLGPKLATEIHKLRITFDEYYIRYLSQIL
ncbi:MAG: M15 family metallopeptidase [Clostridiales bacterium]|nr:M15 family metallopeptidase [Clostridiales bacterium]